MRGGGREARGERSGGEGRERAENGWRRGGKRRERGEEGEEGGARRRRRGGEGGKRGGVRTRREGSGGGAGSFRPGPRSAPAVTWLRPSPAVLEPLWVGDWRPGAPRGCEPRGVRRRVSPGRIRFPPLVPRGGGTQWPRGLGYKGLILAPLLNLLMPL